MRLHHEMVKRKSRPQSVFKQRAAKAVVGKKIPRWQHRAGSIPAPGTIIKNQQVALLAAF
jgi:hypothetical protein